VRHKRCNKLLCTSPDSSVRAFLLRRRKSSHGVACFTRIGDGDYIDSGESNASNTFDKANKYITRGAWTKSHYAAGQYKHETTTGITNPNGFRYDAFGRATEYGHFNAGVFGVAYVNYRYNGLGYRIMEQRDEDLSETIDSDERLYFVYDTRWRQIGVVRDQDANAKEAFVYHNAGMAGMGGSSYIDSVILRDRDANTAWTASSDAALEQRRYYVQNWRADVIAMLNTAGEIVEWTRYTAYGTPMSHPIADVNGDGTVNSADAQEWSDLLSGDSSGTVWLTDDLNRDDIFPGNQNDDDFFNAEYTTATSAYAAGYFSGYDTQSLYGNRKGYAGYERDETIAMWHVRHRVLDSKSGKWTRKDPAGYLDGMNLREYAQGRAANFTDPSGLSCAWFVDTPGPIFGIDQFFDEVKSNYSSSISTEWMVTQHQLIIAATAEIVQGHRSPELEMTNTVTFSYSWTYYVRNSFSNNQTTGGGRARLFHRIRYPFECEWEGVRMLRPNGPEDLSDLYLIGRWRAGIDGNLVDYLVLNSHLSASGFAYTHYRAYDESTGEEIMRVNCNKVDLTARANSLLVASVGGGSLNDLLLGAISGDWADLLRLLQWSSPNILTHADNLSTRFNRQNLQVCCKCIKKGR
jgi:RHS repeat-associated protein